MTRKTITIATFILASCSDNSTSVKNAFVEKTDSITQDNFIIQDTTKKEKYATFLKLDELRICLKNTIEPTTILNVTNIYSQADTLSKIIKKIKFNTRIKLTGKEGISCDWYEIEIDNKIGYIKVNEVATQTFNTLDKRKKLKYFVVADLLRNENNPIIYKYDFNKNKFIDTFKVINVDANNVIIKQIDSREWKNVDVLLYFSNDAGCCGCTNTDYYVMDANSKLELRFTSSSYIDDSEDGSESNTGFSLPNNPLVDTIVYYDYEYGYLIKKNNKPVLDKNGKPKMGVIKDIKKYYHWDGTKLIDLK